MDHFAGLDVSVKETSACIVDDTGKIVREVRVASEPEARPVQEQRERGALGGGHRGWATSCGGARELRYRSARQPSRVLRQSRGPSRSRCMRCT